MNHNWQHIEQQLKDSLSVAPKPKWDFQGLQARMHRHRYRRVVIGLALSALILFGSVSMHLYTPKPQDTMNISPKTFVLSLIMALGTDSLAQNVGVGTPTPDPTAKLEVQSSNSGFLPPRLTTAQRDAIISPAAGLLIYNTDKNCMEYWNGSIWVDNCAACTPPASISHNTPVCEGDDVQLLASVGGIAATYVWSGPNGFSSTMQNPLIANATPAADGIYTVKVVTAGCVDTAIAAADIVVNALNPTPCTGGNLVTNGDFSAGKTGFTSDFSDGHGANESIVTANPAGLNSAWCNTAALTTGGGDGSNIYIANALSSLGNIWCQSITGLTAGTEYTFSFQGVNICTLGACTVQPIFNVTFDGTSQNCAYPTLTACTWQTYSIKYTATKPTVDICIQSTNTGAGAGNDFGFDNIEFRSCP